mmetsp:Transcript_10676/g.22637  ORF Transcript_10676/g.22637 Transcript_10676/m.22637 type:complete len:300 (-) Transcript_10676:1015-1914(-)
MSSRATTSATHYDTLGVPKNADQAAIRKAYLRASLRSHPDKNPGRVEEAKAEFIGIGQAYSIIGDPAKRAAYDRELSAGNFRFNGFRPQHPKPNSTQQQSASSQQHTTATQAVSDDDPFQNFADLFDETVAGMSEEELNMAMGVAAAVGSVIGSFAGSRASKGGNSALSTIGSAIGGAMASQVASSLVKTVHEDSKQRALEKRERDAAIARGEVPEPSTRGSRSRAFQDAGSMFQKAGTSMGGFTSSKRTSNDVTSNSEGEKPQFPWKEAAKLATMAVSACVEMQREPKSAKGKHNSYQ